LKGNPSAILAAIDTFAGQEDFLINVGEHKARVLADIITKESPNVYVEIGGYLGYSALLVGMTMRTYAPGAVVWSLELDSTFATIMEEIVEFAGLTDIVKVVVGPASDSLRSMKEDGRIDQPDMFLLDHVEKLYVSEFDTIEKLGCLKKNAIIIADNVVRPGAPEYREFVRKHERLQSIGVRALITPGNIEVYQSSEGYLQY
jgi:catechol O-methyltransferase